jgi:hypothetical protein
MQKKFKHVLFTLALTLMTPNFVLADAPPPPDFRVYVNYEGKKISDEKFFAEVLKCGKEKSVADTSIIPQLLISEYDAAKSCYWEPDFSADNCSQSQCEFHSKTGVFKIAIFLPSLNKTFVSNAIDREYSGHYGFNTLRYYQVDLAKDNSTKLSESYEQTGDNNGNNESTTTTPTTSNFASTVVGSLIITLILELITALVFALIKKVPKKILLAVLIGNVISVPLLWILVSRFYWTLFPAEIIVVVFEAWLIKLFSQGKLNWKMCLLLSFIMNLISFLVGPFFYRFL